MIGYRQSLIRYYVCLLVAIRHYITLLARRAEDAARAISGDDEGDTPMQPRDEDGFTRYASASA